MPIVWLASYPKSGNTWLRAVLTNYQQDGDGPASINDLIGDCRANSRELFDDYMGLASSDLTPREILRFRPSFHELLAAELPHPTFIKVHDACIRTEAGPLFPRTATARAVYLVRNPLDVAVSLAHHHQWSIDRAVKQMNSSMAFTASGRTLRPFLPEWELSWSDNVSSWADAELPVRVVRYEDMLADPLKTFGAIVRFAGLAWDPSRLAQAVSRSSFDRLRAQEEGTGFCERQPTAPSFFRSGRTGGWRTALAPGHVGALVDAHGPTMERFGYLGEVAAFLAAAEDPRPWP